MVLRKSSIGDFGAINTASIIELSLGLAIGAITFSGSVIAFAKLNGLMSGNPITFNYQHGLNGLIAAVIVMLIVTLIGGQTEGVFLALMILSFTIGFLIIIPIGGDDMPDVVSKPPGNLILPICIVFIFFVFDILH